MGHIDNLSGFRSVRAEFVMGVQALDDGCFHAAHAILLALFLAPEIPHWFRKMLCTAPVRALARTYLPTRASLCRMRKHARDRMLEGGHSAVLLHRTLMLNEALDDMQCSYRLLRHLDVVASNLLVGCRDTVMVEFAGHGDLPRARKYLGNYRQALASLAELQNRACSVQREGHDWAHAELLARADRFVRSLGVIEEILRASGEHQEAASVQGTATLLLTDPGFRSHVTRELCNPGVCSEELRALRSCA